MCDIIGLSGSSGSFYFPNRQPHIYASRLIQTIRQECKYGVVCAGDKMRTGPKILDVKIRFWKYVIKTDYCWDWIGHKNERGYGKIWKNDLHDKVYAHRISYQMAFGDIPDGMLVCHKCDNPSCVNPDHLFLGNQKDNMEDCVLKGRSNAGEKNGNHKLTSENVKDIRASINAGIAPKYMAEKYNVGRPAIFKIIHGQRWALK